MFRIKTCFSVLALLLLCSCANVSLVDLSYMSPGNDGVAIKKDATARLIVNGDKKLLRNTYASIVDALNNQGGEGLKIVTNQNGTPDYFIFVNVAYSYRTSPYESVPYNGSIRVTNAQKELENDTNRRRASETVYEVAGRPDASGALFTSVAIYSMNTLEPVHYFEISSHAGVFADKDGNLIGEENLQNAFIIEIGKKFSDMFLTKARDFTTAIPNNDADSVMVRALKKGACKEVEARAKAIIPDDFDAYVAKVKAAKNPKDFNAGLCSYYLLALSRELNNFDIENLRVLYKQYFQILELTEDEGLAEACASSLARIEKKAQLTGNKI